MYMYRFTQGSWVGSGDGPRRDTRGNARPLDGVVDCAALELASASACNYGAELSTRYLRGRAGRGAVADRAPHHCTVQSTKWRSEQRGAAIFQPDGTRSLGFAQHAKCSLDNQYFEYFCFLSVSGASFLQLHFFWQPTNWRPRDGVGCRWAEGEARRPRSCRARDPHRRAAWRHTGALLGPLHAVNRKAQATTGRAGHS